MALRGISNVSTSTIDALFGKRRVLAPCSVHDVLTEIPRWTTLLQQPEFQSARAFLYELAALKPTQAYTNDGRAIANVIIYATTLIEVAPQLWQLTDRESLMRTLSVWATPRLYVAEEGRVIPSQLDEEIYLALHAVASHLMFFVVDRSSLMTESELVLKQCITAANTAAHIWRSLEHYIRHNEHLPMCQHGVAPVGAACFFSSILLDLTRAQLAEMWVLYHRITASAAKKSNHVESLCQMLFRASSEYENIEQQLAHQAHHLIAGAMPPNALMHIASIKRHYFMAEACDVLLNQSANAGISNGKEPVLVYCWNQAYEKAFDSIKKAGNLDTRNIMWQERIVGMSQALAALKSQHAPFADRFEEASREHASLVSYVDLFGQPALLRQLETNPDGNAAEMASFRILAQSLRHTINECVEKLARDGILTGYTHFADIGTRRTNIESQFATFLQQPMQHVASSSHHGNTGETAAQELPPPISKLLNGRFVLWRALKRLGLCSQRLVTYNQESSGAYREQLIHLNKHLVNLIEMMQLLFYPHEQTNIVGSLINTSRAAIELNWTELLTPTVATFIQTATVDDEMGMYLEQLAQMHEMIRHDFGIYAKLIAAVTTTHL